MPWPIAAASYGQPGEDIFEEPPTVRLRDIRRKHAPDLTPLPLHALPWPMPGRPAATLLDSYAVSYATTADVLVLADDGAIVMAHPRLVPIPT